MQNIPKLRTDLEINFKDHKGEKFILIEDPYLITEPVALPTEYEVVIDLLSKHDDFELIFEKISKYFIGLKEEQLSYLLQNLESFGLLQTPTYNFQKQQINNYLNSNVREAKSAGISYPNNKEELEAFIKEIIGEEKPELKPEAILAPHIDLRLKYESHKVYGEAFKYLHNLTDTKVFILLGTAHYKSSDDLMFTRKNFSTPMGISETDNEVLNHLESKIDITFDDISHLPEHSLETHLIFLQYVMGNKDYKILPILTGSFQDYIENKSIPVEESKLLQTLDVIKKYYHNNNVRYSILSSGDLSHVGKKFGDDSPALDFFDEVKTSDKRLIERLSSGAKDSFLNEIINISDKYRVCGTAPFHTALELTNNSRVKPLEYSYWDELETESVVSFFSGII